MTAKELKQACIKEGVIDIHLLDDQNLFDEFIYKLCKEQREKDLIKFMHDWNNEKTPLSQYVISRKYIMEWINKNAKMPEL